MISHAIVEGSGGRGVKITVVGDGEWITIVGIKY